MWKSGTNSNKHLVCIMQFSIFQMFNIFRQAKNALTNGFINSLVETWQTHAWSPEFSN